MFWIVVGVQILQDWGRDLQHLCRFDRMLERGVIGRRIVGDSWTSYAGCARQSCTWCSLDSPVGKSGREEVRQAFRHQDLTLVVLQRVIAVSL